jgi:hypothetical protein
VDTIPTYVITGCGSWLLTTTRISDAMHPNANMPAGNSFAFALRPMPNALRTLCT